MIERPDPTPTLGERLDAEARALLARARHSFSWSGAYQALAAHLAGLTAPPAGRFSRIEVVPGPRGIPSAAPAAWSGPPAWPTTQASPAAEAGPVAWPSDGSGPVTQPTADGSGPVTQPAADGSGPVTQPAADGSGPVTRPAAAAGQPARTPGFRGPPAEAGTRPEPPAPPRRVPPDVRRRLREVAGPGADVMRVHGDARADAIARAHAADAVTLGADVYFRQGRLATDDRRGEALLAHEASHVSALLGLADAPGTTPGDIGQEALALARERAVLAGGPGDPVPLRPAVQSGPVVQAAQAARAQPTGMGAAADRDTGGEAAPGVDLEALRRSVVDDLMRRLKTEFERGG
jgi:Domain of unknown function (DUF4157)